MRFVCGSCAVVAAACVYSSPEVRTVELDTPADPATTSSLPRTLKLVTLNVHERDGGAIARALARDPAIDDADLAVLQEVPDRGPCSSACVAAGYLGLHAAYAPDYHRGTITVGQAILSRVTFESARTIDLPDFDVHPNAALVVTFRVEGQPVTLYSVHLTDELSYGERIRQMTPILVDARAATTPVIIAGDMNAPINMVLAHAIPIPKRKAAARFEAYVRSFGFDTPVAASGPTWRVMPAKLDGIYTRGFDTTSFGVAHGKDISDHYALWAVLALRAS